MPHFEKYDSASLIFNPIDKNFSMGRRNSDGYQLVRQKFWRTSTSPSKILTHFREKSVKKLPQNISWRIASSVKKSVGVYFWRIMSPSKKSSKYSWRGAGPSKNSVRNFLTEYQTVKINPSKFLTGRSKTAFRRSFFWPTIFPSKWPSKSVYSVKNLPDFRQKFRQNPSLKIIAWCLLIALVLSVMAKFLVLKISIFYYVFV